MHKVLLSIALFLLYAPYACAAEVPVLSVADTINPGTGNYLIQGIETAKKEKRPYVIIQLDTPGGLLHTTRLIVQAMLNTEIPVVVFVGPRGAQAGSAGALLTFAADVAAMAPGSNIGAAHPVVAGGGALDETMKKKLENDATAFAEGLAKGKRRNAAWAARAVKESASTPAADALKEGVIDLIADDIADLEKKLEGWKLRVPKNGITALPDVPETPRAVPMSIRARIVSFFANPELAYLILSFGALCLWIELSHPGLVFPGILGAVCLIVSLVSFQLLPIDYGALAMILVGFGLIIAELYLPTYGVLGVGGLVAFVLGSLFLMDTATPEFRLSLGLILPTAAVLAGFACLLAVLVFRSRNARLLSGMAGMVGEFGEVCERLSPKGKIFVRGELWNARTADGGTLEEGAVVVVKETRDMLLIVSETGSS